MVAYGDREDFLQFLRLVPSLQEGTRRKNCKSRNRAEALPLHDCDFCEALHASVLKQRPTDNSPGSIFLPGDVCFMIDTHRRP